MSIFDFVCRPLFEDDTALTLPRLLFCWRPDGDSLLLKGGQQLSHVYIPQPPSIALSKICLHMSIFVLWQTYNCSKIYICYAISRPVSLPQTFPLVPTRLKFVGIAISSCKRHRGIVAATCLSPEWSVMFLSFLLQLYIQPHSIQNMFYNLDLRCKHAFFDTTISISEF